MRLQRTLEALTEVILYGMLTLGPWAFGTTQPWSIWIANALGYALGALWVVGRLNRRGVNDGSGPGNDAPRNRGFVAVHRGSPVLSKRAFAGRAPALLAGLTIVLLGYCLISAVNRRATYLPAEGRFEYHKCLNWLPHSFDSTSTWRAFWTYLGVACSFWAVREWLQGSTTSEQKIGRDPERVRRRFSPLFPERPGRLIWVLSINGALLALEAIVQREANCPRLLFLIEPQIHRNAVSQFGSFAYRANAAEYFNLLWPMCLGLWWTLQRQAPRRKTQYLLPGCALLMAACPFISTSRGGAFVCSGLLVAVLVFFLARSFRRGTEQRSLGTVGALALAIFLVGTPLLGLSLGWKALMPRLGSIGEGLRGRDRICSAAAKIAQEFPTYGTGPGTYEAVSDLYRPDGPDFWPAQVHNDWLETRITFGIVGSTLLCLAGALVFFRWILPGGLPGGQSLAVFISLGLAGCLLHARFDFPFQVHSILCLFVVLSAVLFTLSRRPSGMPA